MQWPLHRQRPDWRRVQHLSSFQQKTELHVERVPRPKNSRTHTNRAQASKSPTLNFLLTHKWDGTQGSARQHRFPDWTISAHFGATEAREERKMFRDHEWTTINMMSPTVESEASIYPQERTQWNASKLGDIWGFNIWKKDLRMSPTIELINDQERTQWHASN